MVIESVVAKGVASAVLNVTVPAEVLLNCETVAVVTPAPKFNVPPVCVTGPVPSAVALPACNVPAVKFVPPV